MKEQDLIGVAKRYLEMDTSEPGSEELNAALFDLAAHVKRPRTAAGRAIVAYVKAEQDTDYSMSAGNEFEAMVKAVKVAR